jgi:hypothetical protein
MNLGWMFREMARGEVNVDPIQSEFFTTEAIDGQAEAIVREAVQNSLDAGTTGTKVRVCFRISDEKDSLDSSTHQFFFKGLELHLSAPDVGLAKRPDSHEKVAFLTIEDFGTRGLWGDPSQSADEKDERNDFYYFWRNVGRSRKGETDLGRWGLGKNVFPATSRANYKASGDGRSQIGRQLRLHPCDCSQEPGSRSAARAR